MTSPSEPETLAELISDCAAIPAELRPRQASAQRPPVPGEWTVDETCHERVADMDEY